MRRPPNWMVLISAPLTRRHPHRDKNSVNSAAPFPRRAGGIHRSAQKNEKKCGVDGAPSNATSIPSSSLVPVSSSVSDDRTTVCRLQTSYFEVIDGIQRDLMRLAVGEIQIEGERRAVVPTGGDPIGRRRALQRARRSSRSPTFFGTGRRELGVVCPVFAIA